MSENMINSKIEELKELEELKKDLEKQIENIKKDFSELMDQKEEITTNKYLIRFTLCERNTISASDIKKYSLDIYNKFVKNTYYRRFSYKNI